MTSTGFEKLLTILVGVAAVVAALLATLQLDAGRKGDRATLEGSRLPVKIFESIAASGIRSDFHINRLRQANALGLEGLSRQLTALPSQGSTGYEARLGQADVEASKTLAAAAKEMLEIDPRSRGVDPPTATAITAEAQDFAKQLARQSEAIDESNRYSDQGARAVFGLSLAAIAAALLGLAAVLRAGPGGRIAVAAGALALLGSIACGAWAVAS
jgi:hypothetical protein